MDINYISKNNKEDRMEITNKHNISPIEVKSGKNYILTSINKFITKYNNYLDICYIIHTKDFKEKDGIMYITLYMTSY